MAFLRLGNARQRRRAGASPYIYTQIVWYAAGGFLIFGQVPSHYTLAGAAIVIASGLYLLYRERKVKGEV